MKRVLFLSLLSLLLISCTRTKETDHALGWDLSKYLYKGTDEVRGILDVQKIYYTESDLTGTGFVFNEDIQGKEFTVYLEITKEPAVLIGIRKVCLFEKDEAEQLLKLQDEVYEQLKKEYGDPLERSETEVIKTDNGRKYGYSTCWKLPDIRILYENVNLNENNQYQLSLNWRTISYEEWESLG